MAVTEKQQKEVAKRDEKVLKAISAKKDGASIQGLMAKTSLEVALVRGSLIRLRRAKLLKSTGKTRNTLYFAGAGKVKEPKVSKAKK